MDRTNPSLVDLREIGGPALRLTTCLLDRPLDPAEVDELLAALPPKTRALLVTGDASARLPVREGEHAVLLLEADTGEASTVPDVLAARLRDWPSVTTLLPAARALLAI